jgi:hypothetical protein
LGECYPQPIIGGTAAYTVPLRYPGRPWLYCQNVTLAPLGGENNPAQFDPLGFYNRYGNYIATLTFSTVSWEQSSSSPSGGSDTTIKTIDISIGGEYMRLPQYAMYWADRPVGSGKPIENEDIELGKLIPTIEYSVQLHDYAYLPFMKIIELIGKTNKTRGQIIGHEFAETLLFLGASANRTVTWEGAGTFQITYRFSERQIKHDDRTYYGWNHFWRPETSEWMKVKDKRGVVVFPPDDLAELFTATT